MPIQHHKAFGIYHWDTFDDETSLIDEADSQTEAITKVRKHYGDRIDPNGADRVDIVDKDGNVVEKFHVR